MTKIIIVLYLFQLINDVLMNQNSPHEIGTVKNNPDAYEEFFVSVGSWGLT